MSSLTYHTLLQFVFQVLKVSPLFKVKVRLFCIFDLDVESLSSRSQVNMVIYTGEIKREGRIVPLLSIYVYWMEVYTQLDGSSSISGISYIY